MTSARARKDPRQQTSNPPKGEGLRRKPTGPAHLAGPFFCAGIPSHFYLYAAD